MVFNIAKHFIALHYQFIGVIIFILLIFLQRDLDNECGL